MTTLTWKNGAHGVFTTTADWSGGLAPAAGDTLVISSAGDGAPVRDNDSDSNGLAQYLNDFNSYIFVPSAAQSVVVLTDALISFPEPVFLQNHQTGDTDATFPDTPAASVIPAGDTVSGQTIDLLGAGSVVGMVLQDSTLGASTVVNVSGTAVMTAYYQNRLAGTINVGLPFEVNGAVVATPTANPNGVVNELDIKVDSWGSWTLGAAGQYTLNTFVPTTTNAGTINVGDGALLSISLSGGPSTSGLSGTFFRVVPPERSAFQNAGVIKLSAGGLMAVLASPDELSTYGVGTPTMATFENTGLIQLTGAKGLTTEMIAQTAFTGGTVSINGGTATDQTATSAAFTNFVSGTSFLVADATAAFTFINQPKTQDQFSGGGVVFTGDSGLLLLELDDSKDDIVTTAITGNFTMPIDGFRAGDTIAFEVNLLGALIQREKPTVTFKPVWNQSQQLLQIYETAADLVQSATALVAQFTLEGTYSSTSFAATASPSSTNQSAYFAAITTTATLSGGQTYKLTKTPATIIGGAGNDSFIATNGVLASGWRIDGGGGGNTLDLSGAGTFDLRAPTELVNIQTVMATEGQPANGSIAGHFQTLHLRAGLNLTVDVASATLNPANPLPAGIDIYGAANSDIINLGNGQDLVVLGGSGEVVHGGGGADHVSATAATAGALVVGGSGKLTLEIQGGGTAALNAGTTQAEVVLDAATHLMLSKMGFVSALGMVAGNTITAEAAGQTLGGAAGHDTLIGAAAFGDSFSGNAAGLNGDIIKNFGGTGAASDKIDITNLAPTATPDFVQGTGQGTLTLGDGVHSLSLTLLGTFNQSGFQIVTDGHSGSFVTYV